MSKIVKELREINSKYRSLQKLKDAEVEAIIRSREEVARQEKIEETLKFKITILDRMKEAASQGKTEISIYRDLCDVGLLEDYCERMGLKTRRETIDMGCNDDGVWYGENRCLVISWS